LLLRSVEGILAMAEDAPLDSMQLTLFLQIRQERKGAVDLTRRMQVPIAEGTAGLRSAVKERVADLHWFTSGMTLDLLDSKYETEYELEDGAVLADGAHIIVQPATMRLPDIGVPSAVVAHGRAGADPARAGESSGTARPVSADPEGEEVGAALQDFLTNNMKKVMELFREWDEDGDGTITKGEFGRAMRQLGLQVTKAAIDKVFESFDPDGSGSIEFKELNRMVRWRPPPPTPPPPPLLAPLLVHPNPRIWTPGAARRDDEDQQEAHGGRRGVHRDDVPEQVVAWRAQSRARDITPEEGRRGFAGAVVD
jgi:hypothetical protein